MKKLTKQYRVTAALAAVVFCLCVFASCRDDQTYYICIKNTKDVEITVAVYYLGDATNIGFVSNLTGNQLYYSTIPANSAIEFALSDVGYYRVSASPGGRKYARWNDTDDILVIF